VTERDFTGPAASNSQILASENRGSGLASGAGQLPVLPDLLNRRLIFIKDLRVPSWSCPDGSAGVGDDVNRAAAFLAKENMDEPLSFLAEPQISASSSPAGGFRSLDPLSISANSVGVLPKPSEKLNRESVDCSVANVQCSLATLSDSG